MKRLTEVGIRCIPNVSLEYQRAAVNCVKCSHAHLLIKPESQAHKSGAESLAVIAGNCKQPEDASEHPAEAAVA
jgi:hypothetical protein